MKKGHSVFRKIFAYTMLLLLLMSMATALLFARQFIDFYREEQQRQFEVAFEPILWAIGGKDNSPEEIIEIARLFAERNQSFDFVIEEENGLILYSTIHTNEMSEESVFVTSSFRQGWTEAINTFNIDDESFVLNHNFVTTEWPEIVGGAVATRVGGTRIQTGNPEVNYVFTGYYSTGMGEIDYGDLIQRSLLAVGLMLIIAVSGAVLFAKKVTKPLEDEIVRERTMEENQRLFFSAASHELKTPIASARALVEGMIAGVGDYNDHPKYLRECMKTLDSQARLVSEILEIVKLSGKEAAPAINSLDLRELGNTVLAEYQPLAEQRGIVIQGVFPHVKVKADWNLLQRVFSNLMANAIQNTPECGVIKIETEKTVTLRLSILNTGVHIPDEVLSRLFEPFFRMDIARTRHGTQTGLGLAIVKKALDRMAVPFSLENTAEGVRFNMELQMIGTGGLRD